MIKKDTFRRPSATAKALELAARTVEEKIIPVKGSNLTATICLSHSEAASGCKKVLELERRRRCVECLGLGRRLDEARKAEVLCDRCQGTGRYRATETLRLDFDPGMDATSITIPGKGDAGKNGGPAGSFIVAVEVQNHPLLKSLTSAGSLADVELEQKVWREDLGQRITVPTLFGDQLVRVTAEEPDTWPKRVTLAERGLFDTKTQRRADLRVLLIKADNFESPRNGEPR